MKKTILLFIATIIGYVTFGQKVQWKELENFHDVIGATFHPAEENDLKPLKEKSGLLLSRAREWKSSAIPDGYDASLITPLLKKLVKQAARLDKMIRKNKPDGMLKERIIQLHDTFHGVEKCRKH